MEQHEHRFLPWADQTSERCICNALLISRQEKEKRIAEWNNYNEDLLKTPAYLDYLEMKAAFKAKDKTKIAEIKKRIETRGHWGENEHGDKTWVVDKIELVKPSFPNPLTWSQYIINQISDMLPF